MKLPWCTHTPTGMVCCRPVLQKRALIAETPDLGLVFSSCHLPPLHTAGVGRSSCAAWRTRMARPGVQRLPWPLFTRRSHCTPGAGVHAPPRHNRPLHAFPLEQIAKGLLFTEPLPSMAELEVEECMQDMEGELCMQGMESVGSACRAWRA